MVVMSFPGLGIFQWLPTVYHPKSKFISSVVKTFITCIFHQMHLGILLSLWYGSVTEVTRLILLFYRWGN